MIQVGVLTVSDSAAAGTREDVSGPAIAGRCRELGWEVAHTAIVPDDADAITRQLIDWADRYRLDVILSTGGTGIAARDVTPEATRAALDRELPGVPELIRAQGLQQTRFSVLSRGLAGTRKVSFILNLPGSPRGAVHSLNAVADLIPHIVDLLAGRTEHATLKTGGHP